MVGIWGFKNESLNLTGDFLFRDCNKSQRYESILKEGRYEKINFVVSISKHTYVI